MATGNVDNQPLTQLRSKAGVHAVGSYQVAGLPWLTASLINSDTTLTCSFQYVTKNITIAVTGANPVQVHFADSTGGSASAHCFTIDAPVAGNSLSRFTFDVKCKKVFITEPGTGQTGVEVYAALTGILTASMFPLTGPGLDD
jgi:hypothetical protein